jgi:hypothetical protein
MSEGDVRSKRNRRIALLCIATGILIALLAAGFILYSKGQTKVPLPKELTKSVDYTVYYPSSLPEDFSYKPGSAQLNQGGLFYQIANSDDQIIYITEQTVPTNLAMIKSLSGFSPFSVAIGEASLGTQNGVSAAIITTKKTLITINGTQDVPTSTLAHVAKKLREVN